MVDWALKTNCLPTLQWWNKLIDIDTWCFILSQPRWVISGRNRMHCYHKQTIYSVYETMRGYIRAIQNVLLPQVNFWFNMTHFNVYDQRSFEKEKKVEWIVKAETTGRSLCHRQQIPRAYSYILTYSRLKQREPLIALGSHQGGNLISLSTVPHHKRNKPSG